MTFRLQAKNIFLTYPRCTLDKSALSTFLQTFSPSYVVTARELHEDGFPHLHACLCLPSRLTTRDGRLFDLFGFHPNVQPARDLPSVIKYVKKGGSFEEFGTCPTEGGSVLTWAEILGKASSSDEFLRLVSEHKPRDYVLALERLEYFTSRHFPSNLLSYVPPPQQVFTVPEALETWKEQNLTVSHSTYLLFSNVGGSPTPPF